VFCLWAYRPDQFGIGRFVPVFVDALGAAGWQVDVLVPFPSYPTWRIDRSMPRHSFERDGAVRVTRYTPYVPRHHSALTRGLHELSLAGGVLRHLSRIARGADLVIATAPPVLGSRVAARVARSAGVPFVLLVYDLVSDLATDVFPLGGSVATVGLRRLEAELLSRAAHVVALSDEMTQRIERFSGRKAQTSVIPIWADDELLEGEPREAALECRAKLGIDGRRPLVGFSGSYARKQHLPAMVAALGEINGEFTTVFVGDGLERERMEIAAARSRGDVRVLGPLAGRELHGFLSACDLSIVPALTRHGGTGFPSKVANILAAGCPIVAISNNADTELARLLQQEEIGTVCPSLDSTALAHAIQAALALDGVEARRSRCRAYAARHLRKQDGIERFLSVVSDVC